MNKLLLVMAGMVLTLAACSGSAGSLPPSENTTTYLPMTDMITLTPGATSLATPTAPASGSTSSLPVKKAVASLAVTLKLTPDQIHLVSSEAVTWPDGCMGIQRIGVLCTKNQIPGYRIVLEAGGQQYEFHTNQDGSMLVPAQGLPAGGPAEEAARKQLAASLGVDMAQITVLSDAEVEWPDSCLGVSQEGLMCAQMVTPGHLIVLSVGGVQYEYHTNGDGSEIQPATLLLTWKQDGGIAGFCNSLTIYLSGEVHASSCANVKDTNLAQLLTPAESAQLRQWQTEFGKVNVDLSDPKNAADAMRRTLYFVGNGAGQPSPDEQQAMYSWAQTLFQHVKIGS